MRRSLSQSPGRIFYGWWIVAIGCVQDAVKGGLFNTGFTLYFLPVLTELQSQPRRDLAAVLTRPGSRRRSARRSSDISSIDSTSG